MKTIIHKCRNCDVIVKLFVEDTETILADGDVVGGLCELCFEAYQSGGTEEMEKRRPVQG